MKHGQEVINGDHSEGDNIKEKKYWFKNAKSWL